MSYWGNPSPEGAGEMMGTPVAYTGEHFSRSVLFYTQEKHLLSCACFVSGCHPSVPEKSEESTLCLGKSCFTFRELHGGVV